MWPRRDSADPDHPLTNGRYKQGAIPEQSAGSELAIKDLSHEFSTVQGDPVLALSGVDLSVRAREFVSIVGASGCGKTTLLRIVAGLQPYTAGQVFVDGRPTHGPHSGVGMVFQSPALLPWRTVQGNVMLPIRVLGRPAKEYEARAANLLSAVGLDGFEKKYPFELSGGMQQRVAIVRSLIHDPSLLLMDEPFAALDALTRERVGADLEAVWLSNPKTVVFITHNVSEALYLSDRVVVMSPRPGKIVEELACPWDRPRDLSVLQTPEAGQIQGAIRAALHGGVEAR